VGQVTINDIVILVNIALGDQQPSACPFGGINPDGEVTVEQILTAVSNALHGCP